jgi:Ca-activated chloride channel homolog
MRLSLLTLASFAMFGAACSSSMIDVAGSGEFAGGQNAAPAPGGANAASAAPGGEYGATPGGAQDIGVARKMIADGQVPPPDALTVEGLVSEHDIPAEGPACTTLMCSRPAWGWAPSYETGKNERWMSIGMTSGITTFVRPALDAVIVIDKSSSMGIDIEETTEAVARIVDKLRDDDRIAIVTYDDAVKVLKPLGSVGDRAALRTQVKAVDASGGANMSGGLVQAFDIARGAGQDGQRLRRVMLFSCGYPDSQTRGPTSFVDLVEAGATDHIGFSFYGILLGFDFNLANTMSQARGGAYAYADTLERVETLFDTDFDFMVTPIAYDLAFSLNLANGVTAARLYGLPGDATGVPKTSFDVKTAFISRRRGAIIARVQGDQGTGTVRLAYQPETAVREEPNADVTSPIVEATGKGVRKAAFLVNEIEGMKKGCAEWQSGKQDDARASIDKLIALLEPEATAMADAALTPELDLVKKLRSNMK